jgi:peptidoglycan/xylan/chitin deacetylase (PgdA/CDA1 family)
MFESQRFIVAFARPGDTSQGMAARFLGSDARAWMIEDFGDVRALTPGQEVVIPKGDWNPPGVFPASHQLVPVLAYQDIAAQAKGRLVISASLFEQQMRYLKDAGYHAVSVEDLLAFFKQSRQLPRKSVVLTFEDGPKGFLGYAYPLLKQLGFAAALFIHTDQIASRPNPNFLSWAELRDVISHGIEVYPRSKTNQDLRRRQGESESAYERRMLQELVVPLNLLRKDLDRPAIGVEAIAYPNGLWDEDLLRAVKEHGYVAGFTLRAQGNPAFVSLLKINRTQVYADWTLDQFKGNLSVVEAHTAASLSSAMPLTPSPTPTGGGGSGGGGSERTRLAAVHNERAVELESRGALRQALDQRDIALTIAPDETEAQERRRALAARIASEVAAHMENWRRTVRVTPTQAERHLLAALALDPTYRPAFDALRNATSGGKFVTHTVRPRDTTASLADLYYGDRSRAAVIEQANGLESGSRLMPGTVLTIPEIEGVPFLRPDR